MADFFVSYNKNDREWAEWIAWVVEEEGYKCVIQAWDFAAGGNFVLEMQKAAEGCARTIAVLSQHYLDAEFTQPEWAAAFADDPKGEKQKLVMVRVGECRARGILKAVIYADLVGLEEEARERLLEGVKVGRRKPERAPEFPGGKRVAGERPRFPGVGVWNVRHQRNVNFTGRADVLAELHKALAAGGAAAVTQAIHGLGGVGKTQLAVEYAYRHRGEYEIVWWVRAEDAATLADDYAGLAKGLGIPGWEDAKVDEVCAAVKGELEGRGGWLLVLDNAPGVEAVKKYLPQVGGHTVVTSRDANWGNVAKAVGVKVWEMGEAVEFLLKRTGREDRAGAEKVAEALGRLPLALEQAGAYCEETGAGFGGYLELFKTRAAEVLKRGHPYEEHDRTVATTWEVSFEKVKEKNAAAGELLNLCAFFGPDDIPLEMIRGGRKHLRGKLKRAAVDEMRLDEAVGELRRYSLAGRDEKGLSVHRLVQLVTRERLTEAERKAWAGAAVRVVSEAFPFDSEDVRTWGECGKLMAHGRAAAGYAEELGVAEEAAGRVLNQMGLYLDGRAQFGEAKGCYERAIKLGEAVYGAEHPTVATYVNNLGSVLQDLGDLAGAKGYCERALRIDEAAYGAEHPAVGSDVNNLGSVLQALGDLAGARGCYERALRIVEAAHGAEHRTVATVANNLGKVLHDLGDLAGAKGCYERAIKLGEAVYGAEHPTVATVVNNLGAVLRDLGDLAGAKECYERAMRIDEAAYGAEHPMVATIVNNLGMVLQVLGDLAGAKRCVERAMKIDEAAYGAEHPEVATDVNNLGSVLRDMGDLAGAKECFERALRILVKSLGEEHPTTRIVRGNLEGVRGKR